MFRPNSKETLVLTSSKPFSFPSPSQPFEVGWCDSGTGGGSRGNHRQRTRRDGQTVEIAGEKSSWNSQLTFHLHVDIRISEEFIQPYHFLSFELGWDFAICFFLYPTTVTQAKQQFSFFFHSSLWSQVARWSSFDGSNVAWIVLFEKRTPPTWGVRQMWQMSIQYLHLGVGNWECQWPQGKFAVQVIPSKNVDQCGLHQISPPPHPPTKKKNPWYILTTLGKVSIISIFGRCRSFMKI